MADQYFSRKPASRRAPSEFQVTIRGHAFTFLTDAGVFSRGSLDRGSELLVDALDLGRCELVLDIGCGYGAIGIAAARMTEGGRVILTDVNERAAGLARKNLRANGIANAEVREGDLYAPVSGLRFDHILCNPPIRAGRSIVDRIVHEAPAHLLDGGSLWIVARTRQGADAIRARMERAFGNAAVVRRGSGYKVLRSTKATPEAGTVVGPGTGSRSASRADPGDRRRGRFADVGRTARIPRRNGGRELADGRSREIHGAGTWPKRVRSTSAI